MPERAGDLLSTSTPSCSASSTPPGNRGVLAEKMAGPYNAADAGRTPTMDGFVADYISAFTAEMGRQPTYDQYAQIMTGCTPRRCLCSRHWHAKPMMLSEADAMICSLVREWIRLRVEAQTG